MKNINNISDSDRIKPPSSEEPIKQRVQWPEDNPIPTIHWASAAEIDAQIEEIRNSWDDKYIEDAL